MRSFRGRSPLCIPVVRLHRFIQRGPLIKTRNDDVAFVGCCAQLLFSSVQDGFGVARGFERATGVATGPSSIPSTATLRWCVEKTYSEVGLSHTTVNSADFNP
jgi:hypothetical protein